MKRRGSLYARMMLTTLGPLILASACAFLIALTIFRHTLDQRAREQTEHAVQVLAGSDLPLTPQLLQRLAALDRADFYLLDPQGRVALSSGGPVSAGLRAALARLRRDPRTIRLTVQGIPSVAAYGAFDGQDPRYSGLVAVSSLADVRDAGRRAALALAGAVGLATALLALLVHMLTGQITRPLAALAGFAAAIGGGQRGVRVAADRADELGDLARALNDMARRIERYESQLADHSRLSALGEMAARVAHEVRNPLTGLKMHLQLLAERLPSADAPRIRLLLNEIRRLELVVDASLMLARGRAPALVAGDLTTLAAEVLDLMRPTLEHRRIEVTSHLAPVPALMLDRDLIKQALLNLLANAADALPEGGWIGVSTDWDAERDEVRLAVADSGAGFDAEILAAHGRGTRSSKPFGLGLGLTVCREVADGHGGALLLGASESGGALATLCLPLRRASAEPAVAEPAGSTACGA
jgi:signal transduction histidine kinase